MQPQKGPNGLLGSGELDVDVAAQVGLTVAADEQLAQAARRRQFGAHVGVELAKVLVDLAVLELEVAVAGELVAERLVQAVVLVEGRHQQRPADQRVRVLPATESNVTLFSDSNMGFCFKIFDLRLFSATRVESRRVWQGQTTDKLWTNLKELVLANNERCVNEHQIMKLIALYMVGKSSRFLQGDEKQNRHGANEYEPGTKVSEATGAGPGEEWARLARVLLGVRVGREEIGQRLVLLVGSFQIVNDFNCSLYFPVFLKLTNTMILIQYNTAENVSVWTLIQAVGFEGSTLRWSQNEMLSTHF